MPGLLKGVEILDRSGVRYGEGMDSGKGEILEIYVPDQAMQKV